MPLIVLLGCLNVAAATPATASALVTPGGKLVLPAAISAMLCFLTYWRLVRGPKYADNLSLVGKVVVVTGANSGVGLETASALAVMGAHVVMACRSEHRAKTAIKLLRQRWWCEGAQLTFLPLDLSSITSVHKFVEALDAQGLRPDVLINNAGLLLGSRQLSVDGIEMMIAANHLGHFELTRLLLPKLKLAEGGGRVVNVGSAIHHQSLGLNFASLASREAFEGMFPVYADTKLCNLLFTMELDRLYHADGVSCFCVHPGNVITEVQRDMPWPLRFGMRCFKPVMSTLMKSGESESILVS